MSVQVVLDSSIMFYWICFTKAEMLGDKTQLDVRRNQNRKCLAEF